MKIIRKESNIIVSIVLSLIMILGILSLSTSNVSAENGTTADGLSYTVNDDNATITITGYDESKGLSVTIPNEIEGKSVTKIGKNAFSEKNLTSVVLPSCLEIIDTHAFFGNSINSINFPNSLRTIGATAFSASGLQGTLTIPEGVTSIGKYAFGESHLDSVIIPSTVE